MMMQQQQHQQQLMAQPTGYRSNNPFAPGGGGPSMSLIPEAPQLPTPQPQPRVDFFQPPPQQQAQQQQQPERTFNVKTKDTNPELAALWANREGGLDTFGNVGSLRQSLPAASYTMMIHTDETRESTLQVSRSERVSTRVIDRRYNRVSGVGLGIRTRLRVNSRGRDNRDSKEGRVGSNLSSRSSLDVREMGIVVDCRLLLYRGFPAFGLV